MTQFVAPNTIPPILPSPTCCPTPSPSPSPCRTSAFPIVIPPLHSTSISQSSAPAGITAAHCTEKQDSNLPIQLLKILPPKESLDNFNKSDSQNIDQNDSQSHEYERQTHTNRNENKHFNNTNSYKFQNTTDVAYHINETSILDCVSVSVSGRVFPKCHRNSSSAIRSSRTYGPTSAYPLAKNNSKNNVPIVPLGSVSLCVRKSTWLFDLPKIAASENDGFKPLMVVGTVSGASGNGGSTTRDIITIH